MCHFRAFAADLRDFEQALSLMVMHKDWFYKNIFILKSRPMGVDTSIITPSHLKSDSLKIIESNNNAPTIIFGKKLFHSKVDPFREAKRFAESLDIKKGDCVLLYGFGLGYQTEAILRLIGAKGRLVVLELNHKIFSIALCLRDLSSLLYDKRLWLICGGTEKDASSMLLRSTEIDWYGLPDNKKKVTVFLPSYNSIPSGYENLKTAFELLRMGRRFDVLLGCKKRENSKLNSDLILKSCGVREIYGKFKGLPGFLIGSGPSFDSTIKYLKYLPKESVIMAVDSSFATLIENNIKVDFTLSLDPQYETYRYIEKYNDMKVPLIFMPQTNPAILKYYSGQKYVIFEKKHDYNYKGRGKGETDGGGSVGCVGLDLLIKFGADPIITVGIDSSFPGNRYYANEISEACRMVDDINKYELLNRIHLKRVYSEKIINIGNCFGRDNISHLNLYDYFRTMESLMKCAEKICYYQWNSSGAMFDKSVNINMPSSEIFKKICKVSK